MSITNSKIRLDWVDVLRGLCLFFIIFAHVTGELKSNYLLDLADPFWAKFDMQLSLVRTPILFLLSGAFTRDFIFKNSWKNIFQKRILKLIYLYFFWSFVAYISNRWIPTNFLGMDIVRWAIPGIFSGNVTTTWFLFSLVIMTLFSKFTQKIPWGIIFSFALATHIYSLSQNSLFYFEDNFSRTYRFLIYFILGFQLKEVLLEFKTKNLFLGPAAFASFLLFSWFNLELDLPIRIFGLLLSEVIGVVALIYIANSYSHFAFFKKTFLIVGKHSLVVFLSHRIFWWWMGYFDLYPRTIHLFFNSLIFTIELLAITTLFSLLIKKYKWGFFYEWPFGNTQRKLEL